MDGAHGERTDSQVELFCQEMVNFIGEEQWTPNKHCGMEEYKQLRWHALVAWRTVAMDEARILVREVEANPKAALNKLNSKKGNCEFKMKALPTIQ